MNLDGLLERVIADDVEDGGERFFARDWGRSGHVDDCGLDIDAGGGEVTLRRMGYALAADNEDTTLGFCGVEGSGHVCVSRLIDQRADESPRGARVADREAFVHRLEAFDDLLFDGLMDDEAAQGCA